MPGSTRTAGLVVDDPREFYASPVEVQREPELDPPLSMRVESRAGRLHPEARRAILTTDRDDTPWFLVSGRPTDELDRAMDEWLSHDDVRDWYVTCELHYAAAYRWSTEHPPRRRPVEQPAERGDLDVTAFKD